jgi:hypothetical protein
MSGIELIPADRYAHGTRSRYVKGCRCDECRKANTDYANARTKAVDDFNGLVDAAPAREHLLALSKAGVGKRAVQAACDVALSVIEKVRTGKRAQLRARTARRILAVDAAAIADHALVLAWGTRADLRELLRLGLTKTEIAARLGSEAAVPALQLKAAHVTAINALKVTKLLAEVRAEIAVEQSLGELCTACGQSHEKPRRLAWVRAHREAAFEDMLEAQSCWYGDGVNGKRRLHRDRAEVRGEAS